MLPQDIRKLQEAVADICIIKEEIAKVSYEMYQAYLKVGFTKKESIELVKNLIGVNKK